MKIGGDYKKKYILLEIDDKTDQNILKSAVVKYIEQLSKDIEKDSKSEYGADRVVSNAAAIAKCMYWRDHIYVMGSDTWPRNFDFYKHGIERII